MKKTFAVLVLLFPLFSISQNYYLDLKSDINSTNWGSTASVSVIKSMFDNARKAENEQLKTVVGFVSVPSITMPNQQNWNAMTEQEQLYYLLNQERKDRGLKEFELLYSPMSKVSQYFADFLLQNDKFGHDEDQKTPWQRMASVPGYNTANVDACPYAENLAVFMSTSAYDWKAIAAAVYNWNYDDAGSNWGHRRANLYKNFIDNYGTTGKEGFMGVGISKGQYTHKMGTTYNFTTMIVMDFFDPKAFFLVSANPKNEQNSKLAIGVFANNNTIKITNLQSQWLSITCYDLLGNIINNQSIEPNNFTEFYSQVPIIFYKINANEMYSSHGKISNF